MKKINFFSNQIEVTQFLNYLTTVVKEARQETVDLMAQEGVVHDSGETGYEAFYLAAIANTSTFRVGYGKAIINGGLISISADATYSAGNVGTATGNSGNNSIPLPGVDGKYFVYIKAKFIDTSLSEYPKFLGNTVVQKEGYDVIVQLETVSQPSDSLLIGSITRASSVYTYSNEMDSRVELKISTDRILLTNIYNTLTLFFKGFDNGISSYNSDCFKGKIQMAGDVTVDASKVFVRSADFLKSGEFALINGEILFYTDIESTSYQVDFNPTDAAGTYYVYLDYNEKMLKKAIEADFNNLNQLLLVPICKVFKPSATESYIVSADPDIITWWTANYADIVNGIVAATPDATLSPYFPVDIRPIGLVDLRSIQNVFLKNVDALPLALNMVDYRDGTASYTISYYDPDSKINQFIIQGYDTADGLWKTITTVSGLH